MIPQITPKLIPCPPAAAATDDDDDDNNINGEILLSSRGSIKEIGRGKETEHKTLIVPLMAIVCRRYVNGGG